MTRSGLSLSRRGFLGLGTAGLAAASLARQARAARVSTKARIVIIGAGAGGTALVNRLVERLDGAQITLIEVRIGFAILREIK